jgi:hypothetical protein
MWNGSARCGPVRQYADQPSPVLIGTITLIYSSILSCLQVDFAAS